MKPVNIDNLEEVLNYIWDNPQFHDQSEAEIEYPEKTIRCLAGWDTFFREGNSYYALTNSMSFNNLTTDEASLLFDEYCTKELHQIILNAFKKERRLFMISSPVIINERDIYETELWNIIVKDEIDYFSLVKFLGKEHEDRVIIEEEEY